MIVRTYDCELGEVTSLPFRILAPTEFLADAEKCARRSESRTEFRLAAAAIIRPRSRQESKYHRAVQCAIWRDFRGLISDDEAHYDMLATFPVWAYTEDGRRYRKSERDMDHDEFHRWCTQDVIIGAAIMGCQIPLPNEVMVV